MGPTTQHPPKSYKAGQVRQFLHKSYDHRKDLKTKKKLLTFGANVGKQMVTEVSKHAPKAGKYIGGIAGGALATLAGQPEFAPLASTAGAALGDSAGKALGKQSEKAIHRAIDKSTKRQHQNLDKQIEDTKQAPKGYTLDKKLSGKRAQVYIGKDGDVVVAHRGTQGFQDIATDLKFMISKEWAEKSKRFKHAEKVQQQVHEKYNDHHITTMGHSLGGAIAEKVGKNGDKIITLNKAARRGFKETIHEKRMNHQTDIYSPADVVSGGAHAQEGGKSIVVPAETSNPLSEHRTTILQRIEDVDV